MVRLMTVILALVAMGCQPRFHACQPIGESAFEYEVVETASLETSDFGTVTVNVIYQTAEIRHIPANLVVQHIVHEMRDFRDGGFGEMPMIRNWSVYVVGEDSAVWVSPDAYADTLGCSIPSAGMFPALAPGEGQMVISNNAWEVSDALITVMHEAAHTLIFYSTGDGDAEHTTPSLWDSIL